MTGREAPAGGAVPALRRVLVTRDEAGAGQVRADGPCPHVHSLPGLPPALALIDCWYTDGDDTDRTAADPAARGLQVAPRPGGTLSGVVQFPLPTMRCRATSRRPAPFWHETDTVDHTAVLDGELWLVTTDDEVALQPFDVIVVRGGRHAWSNRADVSARLATVGVGLPA